MLIIDNMKINNKFELSNLLQGCLLVMSPFSRGGRYFISDFEFVKLIISLAIKVLYLLGH